MKFMQSYILCLYYGLTKLGWKGISPSGILSSTFDTKYMIKTKDHLYS